MKLINCIFLFALAVHYVTGQRKNPKEAEIFKKLIQDYDQNFRPNEGVPLVVMTDVNVRHISSLSSHKQEITLHLIIHQQWRDYRLIYEEESIIPYISISDPKLIWTPKLNFDLALKEEESIDSSSNIKIFRNGDVHYSKYIIQTFRCGMDFRFFPFDKQQCKIRLLSTLHNIDELIIKWNSYPFYSPKLNTENFILDNYTQIDGQYKDIYQTYYSYIGLEFLFTRSLSSYHRKVFYPWLNLVLCSFSSFWIAPKDHHSKLLISLSCHLISQLLLVYIDSQIPNTNYTKSIDIFIAIYNLFLFCSFITSILTYYAKRKEFKYIKSIILSSRIIIPLIFALFNIIFFFINLI